MIISHSSMGGNGRLGNQLFQIAGTMGLADLYGATPFFPEWQYEQYFDNYIPHGEMQHNLVDELYFHHYDWNLTESCDVRGFLQSEKYFRSITMKLKPGFVEQCRLKYLEVFQRPVICIQVRRGDYVGNRNYYQLPVTFYMSALIKYFPEWKKYNLLVISDDKEYCNLHFGSLPNVYFTEGMDIEDMALASLCQHFIISNSTFGWWCAWFGEKKDTKIIHSGHLFDGPFKNKITDDYRPKRWTEYKRDRYNLDLKDLTFTIPVYFDHVTRKENLDLILYLLQSNLDANYIVCEQGGNRFEYTHEWATYLKEHGGEFHRTKMLNDMCNVATTPYIANWDCDVIIPPIQIYMAVDKLRQGADMIYPYDGRFARMSRQWYTNLQSSFDIGVVAGQQFKGMEPDHNSVGGAVMWNKDSFIDGGMENEYMISFGPEDGERNDRFRALGYDVQRVPGALYHLNHNVGPNSSPRNPFFDENVKEQQKVHNMSRDELRTYIDTWPWRHQYTSRYYTEISEGAVYSAKIILEEYLSRDLVRVIDIGCGVGEWSNGNPNYIGVDYRIDESKLLINPSNYIECDLNKEFPKVFSSAKYDLCLCLEVAEHLKPSRAEPLIEYLCLLSDYVLFSAAIPHQGGQGHINEQWQTYWAELFWKYGFGSVPMPPELRANPDIELWYRQNIVMYKRGAKGKVENFILPEYYEQIAKGLKAK